MKRVRDKSTVVHTLQYGYAVYPDGSKRESSSILSIPQLDRMEDVVVKGFKRASAAGSVIVNPMERVRTVSSAPDCPWWRQRVTPSGRYYNYEGQQGSNGANAAPWTESEVVKAIDRCEALAITSAFAGVGSADLESLTELAELKETLGFLASPARKMAKVTRRVCDYIARRERFEAAFKKRYERWQKRNPKRRGAAPEISVGPRLRLGKLEATDIPSAWLAYRYAIMPLIYSFQDIQKHLQRAVYPERETSRAKESVEVDLTTDPPWNVAGGAEFGAIEYRHPRFGNATVQSRAGVLYTADWSLSRQLGFQIHRVPATMYELIPLTFVFDWFQNGVDVYNALTAELRALNILGSWVSTTVKYDFTYQVEARPLDSESSCATGLTCNVGSGTWTRRRATTVADVRLKFRVELNTKRTVDALALASTYLATAMKRGKPR